jgi:hypothetical protein
MEMHRTDHRARVSMPTSGPRRLNP